MKYAIQNTPLTQFLSVLMSLVTLKEAFLP